MYRFFEMTVPGAGYSAVRVEGDALDAVSARVVIEGAGGYTYCSTGEDARALAAALVAAADALARVRAKK